MLFKRVHLINTILILCIAGCASTQMSRFNHYMRMQNHDAAKEMLKASISENPNNHESYYLLGKVYLSEQNYGEARSSFDKSLELSDSYRNDIRFQLESHFREEYNAGSRALKNGRYTEALALFTRCKKIDPDRQEVYPALAYSHFQLDQTDEARNYYERAIALDENDVESLYNLAGMAFREKDYEKASGYAVRIVRVNRDFLPAQKVLLYSALKLGNYSLSDRTISDINQREPDPELTRDYAFALFNRGEHERALPLLRELNRESGYDEMLIRVLAEASFNIRDFKKMAEYYEQLWNRNPDDILVLTNIIMAYEMMEDEQTALTYRETLYELEGADKNE